MPGGSSVLGCVLAKRPPLSDLAFRLTPIFRVHHAVNSRPQLCSALSGKNWAGNFQETEKISFFTVFEPAEVREARGGGDDSGIRYLRGHSRYFPSAQSGHITTTHTISFLKTDDDEILWRAGCRWSMSGRRLFPILATQTWHRQENRQNLDKQELSLRRHR